MKELDEFDLTTWNDITLINDGIICCCNKRRNDPHNEAMKFKIEYCNKDDEHKVLFP
jgi:hypothetical protein